MHTRTHASTHTCTHTYTHTNTHTQPVGHYTLAGIYLGLRDYVASTLHLRAALHIQPTFSHALSALKLLRCSLKFKEEQGFLKRKVQPCV